MAVFYSFHYDNDVFRVQLVKKIGAVEGQPLLNSQDWEQVRRGGSTAIANWIDKEMKYKTAVIVLIGKETSTRPWVKYEIEKAWNDKRPLLGIYIHGLASLNHGADKKGSNPFDVVDGVYGLPTFDPTQTDWSGTIDTKATYDNLAANLKTWSEQGRVRP